CVFTPSLKKEKGIPAFKLQNQFYEDLIKKDLIMNVWKDGCWGSFRHILLKETKIQRIVDHSYVNCRKYGDLSSFEWAESTVKFVDPKHRKLVHIYYSALNFRDVMVATGKLSLNTVKGIFLHSQWSNK
ncbi:fatty acid synthase, partial [Nephila pilipes]